MKEENIWRARKMRKMTSISRNPSLLERRRKKMIAIVKSHPRMSLRAIKMKKMTRRMCK